MRLASLHIHPLKGARGIQVASAQVEPRGLRHDRRFMLVDARGGFVSQRSHPRLALVQTAIEGETLRLRPPDGGGVSVPLAPEGPRREVEVWGDRVMAVRVGAEASEILSRFLGDSLELVHLPNDVLRPVDPDYAEDGDQVSFADGFPLLLASIESLADLNARLATPLPMDRFRPNLVVEGGVPFAEDQHERVRIGALGFRMPKRCSRCQVTTVDQTTGEPAGPEPLRTLAGYRSEGRRVYFGQNLIPERTGVLSIGDEVELG
jgi:uncharacterized protein YcbX